MFVRIVHLANSREQVFLCLADVSLSRILNQCQLFTKGKILPENTTTETQYKKYEHSCICWHQSE